jgi:hypothetical protein
VRRESGLARRGVRRAVALVLLALLQLLGRGPQLRHALRVDDVGQLVPQDRLLVDGRVELVELVALVDVRVPRDGEDPGAARALLVHLVVDHAHRHAVPAGGGVHREELLDLGADDLLGPRAGLGHREAELLGVLGRGDEGDDARCAVVVEPDVGGPGLAVDPRDVADELRGQGGREQVAGRVVLPAERRAVVGAEVDGLGLAREEPPQARADCEAVVLEPRDRRADVADLREPGPVEGRALEEVAAHLRAGGLVGAAGGRDRLPRGRGGHVEDVDRLVGRERAAGEVEPVQLVQLPGGRECGDLGGGDDESGDAVEPLLEVDRGHRGRDGLLQDELRHEVGGLPGRVPALYRT